jgi:pimeloyl-ACP methyl ester carboxylesterase
MDFVIDGRHVHAGTGGPDFDSAKPPIVFIHGAGMDHSVWAWQTRWFAWRGHGVLALDLPGHGRSDGPPLATIEAMADWIAQVLNHLDAAPAVLVGHSMGSLVALAAASRHADKVRALALVGTALSMAVGQDLRDAAAANSADAIAMINLWGFGARAGMGQAQTPGFWMAGAGDRLLAWANPGVISNDLLACHAWADGARIAPTVAQPVLILQGALDMMTPLKGAKALAAALPNARLQIFERAGHMVMVEEGAGVLAALAEFVGPARAG